MRHIKMTALLLALAVFMTGCGTTGEVENQAYALVLGIDRSEGGIELTIRIPRIGHSGGSEGAASDESYLVLAAAGDGYAQALEHLQWAAARELNLSQVKLIVVSEALARDAAFPELIRRVAETRHLFTTAGFIVCEGSARDFIEGQETILGTRLSSEITAMFSHYAAHGYIPRATFAELYYATQSYYSDPVGIWGFMDAGEQTADSETTAAMISDDEDALNRRTLTASSRQYLGTALFRDGRMIEKLNASETLYLDLLTGNVSSFSFAVNGQSMILSTARNPDRGVSIDGDKLTVSAALHLTAEDASDRTLLDYASAALSRAVEALIRRCQRLGAEPFGFAERAALRFPTIAAWQGYGWREHFQQAEVAVSVEIEAFE